MPVDATERPPLHGLPRALRELYGKAFSRAISRVLDFDDPDSLALEAALLRVEMAKLLDNEDPAKRARDFRLMVSAIDLLRKLTATRYRLSPEAGKNLGEKLAAVIDELNVMLPPEPS